MAVFLSPVGGVAAQFFTNTGSVLTGGKLYTYAAGTTTPATTYTTSAGSTARTNPIILDSAGRVPDGGEIWLTAGVVYKFVLKDSTDVLIATYDNVSGINDNSALSGSTGSSLIGFIQSGSGTVATTVQAKLRESVSVKDFNAKGDGTTDDTSAIQAAITNANGRAVYFPAGTYKTTATISLTNNTFLFANNDATITSTLTTVALAYSGLFVASGALSNISIQGLKFSNTAAKGFAVIYTLYAITNLQLINNECTGCSLLFAFNGSTNTRIANNYIHSPVTEGTFDNYSRAICISYTSTAFSNVIVSGNIITGSWTHGINIQAGDISVQTDPTVAKNANDVVVSNNVVVAVYSASQISAGGIWFSQVQGVSVTGNTVENYGDVGIDFEACTNAVATGNILRNNSKNLTLYGNNLNVRFDSNVCTNTVAGLVMVLNTYADSYSVNTKNTNIAFTNNTFSNLSTAITGAEQIILGTAGRLIFNNNSIYNNFIKGTYQSLKEVEINGNDIFINYQNNASNVQSAIDIVQDLNSTDPLYGSSTNLLCTIQRNNLRTTLVNSAAQATLLPIRYLLNDLSTGTVSFNYACTVTDNVYTADYTVPATSISVTDISTSGLSSYYFSVLIKRNQIPTSIVFSTTNNPPTTVQIADNASQNGLPYFENKTTTGALQIWATSILNTGATGITWSLANGQFVGQTKLIQLGTYGGGTATVTVATSDLGINQNGLLTAAGQYFFLQWHGTAWSTIKSTGSGL